MIYAQNYSEQVETGKLWLEGVPDHYKWSFMKVWEALDKHMKRTMPIGQDLMRNTMNIERYKHIMNMIIDTSRYSELIRNVYHAKLLYPDELGYIEDDKEGLVWLSLPEIVRETSPYNSDYCPCCWRKK